MQRAWAMKVKKTEDSRKRTSSIFYFKTFLSSRYILYQT
ncbi:hypothetical protein GYO_3410 [Bacillus spizizenii TU-B-10]|uniref:Uncharacterized protein n=1 Tax=Bacillus spizizenii (strain DSM 15029 / JCM 12233 / NBRC 101239 / NRRL B-23049 / TU-B-10) TaxID=1052585 RepID=G4P009_BACS4|nr:hypothetical protein GYO_3410 [Bacillus spizizenii TU-B-10]